MSTVSASANAGVVIAAKTHYSAAEIAALRLPGLPSSIRGIEKAAARGEWPYREAPARGGRTGTRREYAVASLPVAVRQALAAHSVSAAPVAGRMRQTMNALVAIEAIARRNKLATVTAADLQGVALVQDWRVKRAAVKEAA